VGPDHPGENPVDDRTVLVDDGVERWRVHIS